jgi:hypothetical protein
MMPVMRVVLAVLFTGLALADDLRPIEGYRAIMWVSGSAWKRPEKVPLILQRLQEMGVNTGMITGDGDASAFVKAGMPYYVENIVGKGLCLKYNSPVTKWSDFVNGWMKSRDEASLVRPYCLDDPEWNGWAQKRMRDVLRGHKANAPVLADIRDELSTTISANPFDYDLSPQSLAGFRVWLKTQYADLAALNKEWETDFPSWDAVRPFTTDQIKARMVTGERMPKGPPDWSKVKQIRFDPLEAAKSPTKWNFAPWCDFRSYMDTALARALDGIRRAGWGGDPGVPIGIEGTQMPHAFGGYDLWKLSQSVDWMEPYDVGCAREILGSFMPKAPFLTTVFEKDTEHALRRLWHLLLLGDKGCVVWWSEDCIDLSKEDCPLTDKAKALAPALKEMTSPLARLFMRAEREYDPIAIHYSQASIQVAWLMESAQDGQSWPRRFSSYESQHSRHAAVRNGWLKLLQDLGYSPKFVSTEQIENGELEKGGYRVLVMPDSWQLSAKESEMTMRWIRGNENNRAVVSGLPGTFREHSILRSDTDDYGRLYVTRRQDWAQWVYTAFYRATQGGIGNRVVEYSEARVHEILKLKHEFEENGFRWVGAWHTIAPKGDVPYYECIRTHRFRLGNARLLAFERNVDYHMSEDLKQAGGNEALEKPVSFEAKLPGKAHVYDLRSGAYLGDRDRIPVELDPWRPSLFALLPERLAEGRSVVVALGEESP